MSVPPASLQAADDGQPVLAGEGHRRERRVQAQHFGRASTVAGLLTPVMPVRNTDTRSVRGKIGGRQAGGIAGQHQAQQRGQRRVGDVVEELRSSPWAWTR